MASNVQLSSSMLKTLNTQKKTNAASDLANQRLASNLKVESALDGAIAFFSAKTMNARAAELATIRDDITNGTTVLSTATKSIDSMISLLDNAKAIAGSARAEKDADVRANYINQINESLTQIVSMSMDSSHKGTNLVKAVDNIDLASTAGTAAQNRVKAPGSQYAQAFQDARTNEMITKQGLVNAILSAGTTEIVPTAATPPVWEFTVGTAQGWTDFNAVTQATARKFDVATTGAQVLGTDIGLPEDTYSVTLGSTYRDSSGKVYICTKAGVATAGSEAQAEYTQVDLNKTLENARGLYHSTTDNANAGTAKYQATMQTYVNLECRSNSDVYKTQAGYVDTEKLTVILSEQDKSRKVDVQAKALGDMMIGLVSGSNALTISGTWSNLDGSVDTDAIDDFIELVDNAKAKLEAYAGDLANYNTILSIRAEHNEELQVNLQSHATTLTEADTNAEAAKSTALATRITMGLISMSQINQAYQGIQRLF